MRQPRAWQTQATAPGGTREASPRHKDRGLGPTGRERESGNAAWRVERTRAHASCAPGTRRSGPARQIGPVWRNPGHAPSRRATPLMGEKEKRRALPRPTQVRDQHSVGFLYESQTRWEVTEAVLRGTRCQQHFSSTLFRLPGTGVGLTPTQVPGFFCVCRCSRLAHLLSAPHLLCTRPSGTMRPHFPLLALGVPRSLMQLSCPACAAPTEHRLLYSKNGSDILRCEQCGLGRAQASGFDPGTYYTDDYFSGGHADGYADYRGAEPVLRREFAGTVDFIRRHREGGRLLDVGCAYGFFLEEAKRFYDV